MQPKWQQKLSINGVDKLVTVAQHHCHDDQSVHHTRGRDPFAASGARWRLAGGNVALRKGAADSASADHAQNQLGDQRAG